MEKIVYSKNLNKEDLLKYNIVIEDSVDIKDNVKLSHGVCILGSSVIEANCIIENNSIIENSHIGCGVEILSSHISNSKIGECCTIGPFANIKKQSIVGKNCRIGNFVEVKNSMIGDGSKIAHLAYVGDAEIGQNCNIGCGVVFCNYNGKIKQRSVLGDKVFIGCNVNIIAPVKIESETYIAAGSTITMDVENGQFAIARSRQINKNNFNNPYMENFKNDLQV